MAAAVVQNVPTSQQQKQGQGQTGNSDRSLRSVFVGNIPYEASEEQLKDIFSEVGPVVSFRLVFDRETGKPKGYGFCEYKDQETALSAMRNLNGYELNGRALRVDSAASEKNREELKGVEAATARLELSPYGPPVAPEEAPEAITQAVASLPPEQMFELMKQMKICIQNNPEEARQMLLQNPQLAYALLQAQVVMKIVDPVIAQSILHRPTEQADPIKPNVPMQQPGGPMGAVPGGGPGPGSGPMNQGPPGPQGPSGPFQQGPGQGPEMRGPLDMRRPPDQWGPGRDDDMRGRPDGPDMRGRPNAPDMRGRMDGPDMQGRLDGPDMRGRLDVPDMRGRPEGRGPIDGRGPPIDVRGPPDHGMPPNMHGPPDRGGPGPDPRDFRGPPDMRDPREMRGGPPGPEFRGPPDRGFGDHRDPRGFDPRDPRAREIPRDERRGPIDPRDHGPRDPRGGPPEPRGGPPDPRGGPPDHRGGPPDPRGGPPDHRGGPPDHRGGPPDHRGGPPDPRGGPPDQGRFGPSRDPRGDRGGQGLEPRFQGPGQSPQQQWGPPHGGPPMGGPGGPGPGGFNRPPGGGGGVGPGGPGGPPGGPGGAGVTPQDQEKAALIMQVLSLTDQQIALLPEDQRQSIMVLKEQINQSTAHN